MREESSINKKLISLAFPMSVEGLLTAAADFVDTLMVSSLGEASVSAVGLGTQIFFIQSMTIYGFAGGASTYMSQFYGSGNWRGIRGTLSITVGIVSLLSALLFAAVFLMPEMFIRLFTSYDDVVRQGASYMVYRSPCLLIYSIMMPVVMALKSTQRIKLPVFASVVAIFINIGCNYALIYGKFGLPAMGADGAGLATTISQAANLLILIIGMIIGHNPLLQDKNSYFSFKNKELVREIFKNSVPTTLNEMLWSGGMSAYNAAYGRISIAASAAAQAADIVTHIFTKTIYSVGDASLIMTGELLGSGAKDKARSCAKKLLRLNAVLGAICGALLVAVSYPIAGCFRFEDESFRYLAILLCLYGVFMPLKVYNVTLVTGILRAGGDVRFAMVTEVSAIWLVSVPLVFVSALIWELPIFVVVAFAQTEDLVKCIVLTKRFMSGKWVNNKVEKIDV